MEILSAQLGAMLTNGSNAAADGHTVNNTPKEGSIYNHLLVHLVVAYVENVNSDGSIEVSEMNYQSGCLSYLSFRSWFLQLHSLKFEYF